ncbi:MAG: capsid protein [Wigfec virus K19_259]|nr:MAG: capsid protein [Wigfec virus K19_259]
MPLVRNKGGSSISKYNKKRDGNNRKVLRRKLKRGGRMSSKFVNAQINPFSADVYGVRCPDTNTAPSTALFSYDTYSLLASTNASSVALASCHLFRANSAAFAVASNGASSSSWTWPAAFGGTTAIAQQATYENTLTGVRVLAHGVRISCPLTLLNTTGYVHVCLYPQNMYDKTTWSAPTTIASMNSLPGYKRMTLVSLIENPLIVVNKFTSSGAFNYRAPSDDNTGNSASVHNVSSIGGGWMDILIAVEGYPAGAASSTTIPVVAENIIHYEAVSDYSNTQLERRDNAEPANTPIYDAASHVSATEEASFYDNVANVADRVRGAAHAVAETFGYESGSSGRLMEGVIESAVHAATTFVTPSPYRGVKRKKSAQKSLTYRGG